MSDNNPPSDKSARWKKRWRRKKNRQAKTQNSYYATEDSFSQASAAIPQLRQTGETSAVANYAAAKLHNPSSNERTRKKKQKKKQQTTIESFYNTTSSQTLFKGADFTVRRTITFHPRISSDHSSEGSSSQSTTIVQSQGGTDSTDSTTRPNCETSTSALFTPNVQEEISADVKPHSSAVAGPSRQSSVQRKVGSFSFPQVSAPVAPSKYLAIDCEMVGTGPKGRISHLARCSIVSYDGDVVYDKFIKPPVPVTAYRTPWSGIRPRDLQGATPYAEARKQILQLVRGKVLIGHAIHNDLKVLSYSHPKDLTRDTSRIPLLNVKAGFSESEVVSLKRFTKALFNKNIQTGRRGHSSVEDAKATMELYKVVEVEWERTLASTAKNYQTEDK